LLQHKINLYDSDIKEKYKLVKQKMTWKNAADYCKDNYGSDLVSIGTSTEAKEFENFIRSELII